METENYNEHLKFLTSSSGEDLQGEENMYTTFFQETGRGKFVPRAIYVDLLSLIHI